MIRCVRLWTGEDGNSLFEEGIIEFKDSSRGDSESFCQLLFQSYRLEKQLQVVHMIGIKIPFLVMLLRYQEH